MREIIVVSGGIASGKSLCIAHAKTRCKINATVFSFDEYTKTLYSSLEVKEFLNRMFGTTNKTEISNMVFNNPEMLEVTNSFFFKYVESKFIELINFHQSGLLIIEFPMFFEMLEKSEEIKLNRHKFKVLLIHCDPEIQKSRALNRDKSSIDKVNAIINSQVSFEHRLKNTDYHFDTSSQSIQDFENFLTSKFKKLF